MPLMIVILQLYLVVITIKYNHQLTSCSASGERFKRFHEVAENQSSIYIYRPSKFFQGGTWPTFFIDGQEKFSLKNSGYIYTLLDAGQHEIKSGATSFFDNWIFGDVVSSIDIEQGKTYYLRFDIAYGGASSMGTVISFSGNAGLISVSKEQAETDLKKSNSSM